MNNYIAFIIKIGNGYLKKDPNISIMGPKYYVVFKNTEATWFSRDDVIIVAKRYGGEPLGLLPVVLDKE